MCQGGYGRNFVAVSTFLKMLIPPTFVAEFDIQLPVYIRKIASRARWEVEGNSIKERAQKVVDGLFSSYEVYYSIWLVNSDKDFMGL